MQRGVAQEGGVQLLGARARTTWPAAQHRDVQRVNGRQEQEAC